MFEYSTDLMVYDIYLEVPSMLGSDVFVHTQSGRTTRTKSCSGIQTGAGLENADPSLARIADGYARHSSKIRIVVLLHRLKVPP